MFYSGNFQEEEKESKLAEVDISLDLHALFRCLVRQINKAIKSFVVKQKPETAKKQPKQYSAMARSAITNKTSRDDHLRAAQALSELDKSGDISPNRNKKRSRDAEDSMMMAPPAQEKRRSRIRSFGSAAEIARMADEERMLTGSGMTRYPPTDNMNMNALYRHQNGGMSDRHQNGGMSDIDATMQALNWGNAGNGNESNTALLEALRLAELDMLRRRSSAGNSMGAAAEAVKLSEAENNLHNLHSLSSMQQMGANSNRSEFDSAMNGALRGTSYTNNSMSAASDAIRMADMESALNNLAGRASFNTVPGQRRTSFEYNNSMSDAVRFAEIESALALRRGSRPGQSMATAADAVRHMESAMRHGNRPGDSMGTTAEAVRQMESAMRHGSRPGDSMGTAADAVRMAEMDTAFRRGSRPGDSMNAAADAVRLAEMMRANTTAAEAARMNGMESSRMRRHSRPGDSMNSAAEAVRMAEIEASMRHYNRQGDSMNAAAEAVRMAEIVESDRRRRSSLTEAMTLVQMDVMRRSSAGSSMAAAAEAVRLAEMEAAYSDNQRRFSYADHSHLSNSDSLDSLADFMRRSSGATGSMAAAAEAVRMTDLERIHQMESWRRSSGHGNNHFASAAEGVRLQEIENEMARQVMTGHGVTNDVPTTSVQMTRPVGNASGRRVSFGPDTMRDQLMGIRHQRMN